MDWIDFTKNPPNKTGLYMVFCQGINYAYPYQIAMWDGTNFTCQTTQTKYPFSVSAGGTVNQSASVAFYSPAVPITSPVSA